LEGLTTWEIAGHNLKVTKRKTGDEIWIGKSLFKREDWNKVNARKKHKKETAKIQHSHRQCGKPYCFILNYREIILVFISKFFLAIT